MAFRRRCRILGGASMRRSRFLITAISRRASAGRMNLRRRRSRGRPRPATTTRRRQPAQDLDRGSQALARGPQQPVEPLQSQLRLWWGRAPQPHQPPLLHGRIPRKRRHGVHADAVLRATGPDAHADSAPSPRDAAAVRADRPRRRAAPVDRPALSGRKKRFASIVRRVQIALLAHDRYAGAIDSVGGPNR